MYDINEIHRYGYAPIGDLKNMIVEAITQLAALGMTRQEIADVMNVTRTTVGRYIDKYDIPISDKRSNPTKKLAHRTVEEFTTLLKTHSLDEICDEWNTNMVTLREWRREKGLTVNRRGNSR